MKRSNIFSIVLIVGFVLVFISTFIFGGKEKEMMFVKAKMQDLEFGIVSKGEIKAARSTPIFAPELFYDSDLRLHQLTLSKIIPEGTFVKKGDYVATLEGADISRQMQRLQDEITENTNNIEVAKLDSSVSLSKLRDEIEQTKLNLAENKLVVEQSIYETKAIQRQSKLSYERRKRLLSNKIRNYQRRLVMEGNKVQRYEERLENSKELLDKFEKLQSQLKIHAPDEGILLYAIQHGKKLKAGSSFYRWGTNSSIATLPNLDSLISETYVNEIDVTKLNVGQKVSITVDAFPDKSYEGSVMSIANMGVKVANSEFKSFKVEVKITSNSKKLKPAMTTNNKVILETKNNELTVPLNSVFSDGKASFVYLKSSFNIVKKEVQTGLQNRTNIIIVKGLSEHDKVLVREPSNKDELKFIPLKG